MPLPVGDRKSLMNATATVAADAASGPTASQELIQGRTTTVRIKPGRQ